MAIPKRRARLPGTYFVTSRTWESRSLFTTMSACKTFVETLFHYRNQEAYKLHAFVLMPEHFHLLITPASNVTLERAVQYIKGGSAHRLGQGLDLRFPLWQRGFSDHRIRDNEDYLSHVRYIEQNPVKAQLVEHAGQYSWSSAAGEFPMDDIPQGLKPRMGNTLDRHGLSRALTRD